MTDRTERRGAVICGACGMGNAGDDAVLAAITAALRKLDGQLPITVMARRPRETAKRFGVTAVHPLRPLKWLYAMRASALFISGGGSLLQDVTSRRSLWYYLATIRLAKKCGCAVQLYGCGIGPLMRGRSRAETARVLNECADVVTVRDGDSLALLKELGVTEPRLLLAADPALSLAAPRQERERRFGVVLRPWPSLWPQIPALARAVRYAYETYRLAPVFFCLAPGDREAAESVRAELDGIPCAVSVDSRRLGRMSLVLSMRLHGLIFALRDGVPAAGISYDPKVSSFCREAGLPALPLETADEAALCSLIDEAAHLDTERLSESLAALRRREQANLAAAAQLMSERET